MTVPTPPFSRQEVSDEMPTGWQRSLNAALIGARDFALTILVVGGAEILVSLLVWPILFRAHPQGFALALSLVGFGGWGLSLLLSLGRPRYSATRSTPTDAMPGAPTDWPVVGQVQAQLQRSGCGFVLLISSILPLCLAFILRVRADMQAGLTWSELFPPMP